MRTRENQRHRTTGPTTESLTPQERRAVSFVNRSAGSDLDPSLRAAIEPHFAHSLSDIRVHTDAGAGQVADALGATAVTVADHVVFGSGAYDPDSPAGQYVIAHELAHVVQNERLDAATALASTSDRSDAAEADAEVAAQRVMQGDVAAPSAAPTALVSTFLPHWLPGVVAASTQKAPQESTPPVAAPPKSDPFAPIDTASKLLLDHPQAYQSVAEGWKQFGGKKLSGMPDGLGDAFGLLEGFTGLGVGMGKIASGDTLDGILQTGSGLADATSGIAGLAGNNPVSNIAGGISDTISFGGGLYKAIASDDIDEATEGAQDALTSGFDAVSNFAGGPTTPVGAVAAAGGLGARVGTHLVNASDSFSEERGYFHDDFGNAQSGSSEAADWGTSVDEWFGEDNWLLDKVGGVAGGLTAIGGGIGNTAYGYGRRGVEAVGDAVDYVSDNVTLDPDEIDWGRTFTPWNW
jgi:hypothetical protein